MIPGASRAVALVLVLALASCALWRHEGAGRAPTIDLNTASLRALEQLPGVTPSMARRIVEGRPYRTPEELVERGILSERELERIADRVTVTEPR